MISEKDLDIEDIKKVAKEMLLSEDQRKRFF